MRSGDYILGFRIDPVEALKAVYKEVKTLWQVHSEAPTFGVKFSIEERPKSIKERTIPVPKDEMEIVHEGTVDSLAVYGTSDAEGKPPVYDEGAYACGDEWRCSVWVVLCMWL